jgi:hypothetical protein
MSDAKPRKLIVGEEVFIGIYTPSIGWSSIDSYRSAKVEKITTTGIIKIRIKDWVGYFRADGKGCGKTNSGWIDWTPYAERQLKIEKYRLLNSAYIALRNIPTVHPGFDAHSLAVYIATVESAIANAKGFLAEAANLNA